MHQIHSKLLEKHQFYNSQSQEHLPAVLLISMYNEMSKPFLKIMNYSWPFTQVVAFIVKKTFYSYVFSLLLTRMDACFLHLRDIYLHI